MINTILFDLDGTLLDFNQDEFLKLYLEGLAKKFILLGHSKEEVVYPLLTGVEAMLKNSGDKTNEDVFWDSFLKGSKYERSYYEEHINDFYHNEFNEIGRIVSHNKYAHLALELLKQKNDTIILATNPLFPKEATHNRMSWGKYGVHDFEFITTFENSNYTKPSLKYYEEILNRASKDISECLMVGNDTSDDMVVEEMGMDFYLVVDNLIDEKGKDYKHHKHGSFKDFYEYVKTLKVIEK